MPTSGHGEVPKQGAADFTAASHPHWRMSGLWGQSGLEETKGREKVRLKDHGLSVDCSAEHWFQSQLGCAALGLCLTSLGFSFLIHKKEMMITAFTSSRAVGIK